MWTAHNSNDQLIGLVGGSGSVEEREAAQNQWREWCLRRLSDANKDRKTRKHNPKAVNAVMANTAEETAAALAAVEHWYRIYSDRGSDGNGAKGH
jgi:hypothetical protein